ncbi:MAG: tetratricopeptide repeat protein [Acidobacteriota bacterium]|nr:tetratricopeptide repeat protein [Acidobacteriota bacterium]
MAKQRRSPSRAAGKKAPQAKSATRAKSSTPARTKPAKAKRSSTKGAKKVAVSKTRKPTSRRAASKSTKTRKPTSRRSRTVTPITRIRDAYAKAVGLYERGLKALQRKNYASAATTFRQVLEQFPDERELHERARLYLNVCEREIGPKAKTPRTVDDRILAATVAVNQRRPDEAVSLLRGAVSYHPTDDRLHYLLAIAHALRSDGNLAAKHLAKAIALNPDNRVHARHEPDFDAVRGTQPFINALS